jgi:hypothetical protein
MISVELVYVVKCARFAAIEINPSNNFRFLSKKLSYLRQLLSCLVNSVAALNFVDIIFPFFQGENIYFCNKSFPLGIDRYVSENLLVIRS